VKHFAILLAVSPDNGTLPLRALDTIKTALTKGFAVFCFLYEDGVHLANQTRDVPQGERDLSDTLATLACDPNCDIVACITAAERRGVHESNLVDNVRVGGLGEWTERLQSADCVVQFR
jgi:tRNA 2-thiouridine synthesizing protein D